MESRAVLRSNIYYIILFLCYCFRFGIAIGYSVVVGWILKYTVGSIDGSLFRETNMAAYFGELVEDFGSIPWHIMGIVICVLILIGGVKGIELANMVLIPLFYILFMILLVRVLTLPNIKDGIYGYYC